MTWRGSRAPAVALATVAPLALGGCLGVETTQEKSAKRSKLAATRIAHQKGLKIGRTNPFIKVEQSAVVQDPNGVAAVVRVRNTGDTQVTLPVAITVADAKGKKLYANDAPGLDKSLVSLPVLRKGEEAYWVNNQILVAGKAQTVDAVVGTAQSPATGAIPTIAISGLKVGHDADGVYAAGIVRNDSAVAQRRLVVSCIARQGNTLRAAGRAIIDRLPPAAEAKKPIKFTVYFIGDPKGAALTCSAPPTDLPGGAGK
jgi:hypothetical protein